MELLPTTAGSHTPEDAVGTAHLARQTLGTDRVLLELTAGPDLPLPDAEGLLEAARVLVRDGHTVLAWSPDDPVVCRRLGEIGCAAVLLRPLPGAGLPEPSRLGLPLAHTPAPLVLEVHTSAEAARALALGAAAVLVDEALRRSDDPVALAVALREAAQNR
mgnify:CR=1 FL=1